MGKPKKKKKAKKKKNYYHYKLFVLVGGLFHAVTYFLYDLTLYSNYLFWLSAIGCGLFFGYYFIQKMKLLDPNSYRKIEGFKLKMYMLFICIGMVIGGVIIFGNVLNGTILGLNYLGKGSEVHIGEYRIEKITRNRTTSRKRRRSIRRNNPLVYLEKENEIVRLNLPERYSTTKDYAAFKTIRLNLKKGLFGYEIMDKYELLK